MRAFSAGASSSAVSTSRNPPSISAASPRPGPCARQADRDEATPRVGMLRRVQHVGSLQRECFRTEEVAFRQVRLRQERSRARDLEFGCAVGAP